MRKEPSRTTFIIVNIALLAIVTMMNINSCRMRSSVINEYRNELDAYRNYYMNVEHVLFYSNSNSVPTDVYNQYLNALTDVQQYRMDE